MRLVLLSTLVVSLVACRTTSESSTLHDNETSDFASAAPRPTHPQVCAAFRGNGNLIFGHWGAMARLLEDFGPIEGVAGGSSGALTSFLYENMYRSPATWRCAGGSRACNTREAGNRLALLMKTLVPYIENIYAVSGIQSEIESRSRIALGLKVKKINGAVGMEDWDTAGEGVLSLIDKPEYTSVINGKLLQELKTGLASNDPAFKAKSVKDVLGAAQALQWEINDTGVLFRRGLIRMEQLGDKAGVTADFYAGIEGTSAKDLGDFLDKCTNVAIGKDWFDVARLSPTDSPSEEVCGTIFSNIVENHFNRVFKSEVEGDSKVLKVIYASKSIDEPIGKYLPVVAIDSYFADKASLAEFQRGNQSYLRTGVPPVLAVDSTAIKAGYFARSDDLDNVVSKARSRADMKSQMTEPLGELTWRDVLSSSPLEPGLESAQCLVKEGTSKSAGEWRSMADVADVNQCVKLSIGGWIDLEPVNALKDIGCNNVIMVHRAGGATDFALKMIRFMSRTPAQEQSTVKRLYDLSGPTASSYAENLTAADGVVCTNWDNFTASSLSVYMPCLVEHGYHSKILSAKPDLLRPMLHTAPRPFDDIVDSHQLTYGCRIEATPEMMPPTPSCNL